MAFKTLYDIRTKIARDLDIEAEEFIQPEELIQYINDAISEAEANIINLGLRDKYFLARGTPISLVAGQADYDLPSNIYGNKILKVVYQSGTDIYALSPIDSEEMYQDISVLNQYNTTDLYRYLIRHDVPGTEKLQIVPKARVDAADALTIWFFREANKLEIDTDICDLPEIAIQYVYQSVRVRVYEKERGQSWMVAKEDLAAIEELMVKTLQQQISDSDLTKMDKDFTTYEEHS